MEQFEQNETMTKTQRRNATAKRQSERIRAEQRVNQVLAEFDSTSQSYAGLDHSPKMSFSEQWEKHGKVVALGTGLFAVGVFCFENASTIATLVNVVKNVKNLVWRDSKASNEPVQRAYAPSPVKQKKTGSWWKTIGAVGLAGCAVAHFAPTIPVYAPAYRSAMSKEEQAAWIEDGEEYDPLWDVNHLTIEKRRVGTIKFIAAASLVGALTYGGVRLVQQWLDHAVSPIGAERTTRYIESSKVVPLVSSSDRRQVFTELPLVRSTAKTNHTHGKSARDRNAGSATSVLAARTMGLEPYFIQMSLSDQRKGFEGCRSYHWAKDLGTEPLDFDFDPERHAAVLVDVDHYLDMPSVLARYFGTYFVSTFQPSTAACSTGEYQFRFDGEGKVHYQVSGGESFEHEIWDYAGCTLLVDDEFGATKTVSVYHIDRKQLDDHHVLIMLSPIAQFQSLCLVPTEWLLQGRRLQRFNPVDRDFVVMDIVRETGLCRSIAIVGQYNAVTLTRDEFDAVEAVARVAKVPITPAMVASNLAPVTNLGMPTERKPPGHCAIVAGYLRQGVPHSPPVVFPPSECLVPIYFQRHDYDAPVAMRAFGSPLIGPVYGQVKSIHSDDRMVAGRVEKFQGRQFALPIPPSIAGYMGEFVERLIPVPNRGVPVDEDFVRNKQDSSSQKAILDEAAVTGDAAKVTIKAFQKVETYQKVTDPRNISTLAPDVKLEYSRFLYSFHEDVMCNQEWYAFGNRTPAQCAARVVEILKHSPHCVLADGSRFEAHVTVFARILERMCMMRFFQVGFWSELHAVMDKQYGIPGVTTEGRRYEAEFTRASGSPETADFNSLLTAFIDFCAWRNTLVDGRVHSADEAWDNLGIYGGDDSLARHVDPEQLVKSAKMIGQDYEVQVVRRGDQGVEFLNRRFGPDVWHGDDSSMANPSRLLSKLWVGPAGLTKPLERFAERAAGYYRMDKNSPVVGPIVKLAHQLLGDRVDGELMPWHGKFSAESNWPNEDSGWMMDVFTEAIPDFDWERFWVWINDIEVERNPALLLCAPLCTAAPEKPAESSVPAVVGEEFIVPKEKQEESAKQDETRVQAGLDMDLVEGLMPVMDKKHCRMATKFCAKCKLQIPVGEACGCVIKAPVHRVGGKLDPREWTAPTKLEGESPADFTARLKDWEAKRAKVAKRLGVALN